MWGGTGQMEGILNCIYRNHLLCMFTGEVCNDFVHIMYVSTKKYSS